MFVALYPFTKPYNIYFSLDSRYDLMAFCMALMSGSRRSAVDMTIHLMWLIRLWCCEFMHVILCCGYIW